MPYTRSEWVKWRVNHTVEVNAIYTSVGDQSRSKRWMSIFVYKSLSRFKISDQSSEMCRCVLPTLYIYPSALLHNNQCGATFGFSNLPRCLQG